MPKFWNENFSNLFFSIVTIIFDLFRGGFGSSYISSPYELKSAGLLDCQDELTLQSERFSQPQIQHQTAEVFPNS
jgi:hypothetical protein